MSSDLMEFDGRSPATTKNFLTNETTTITISYQQRPTQLYTSGIYSLPEFWRFGGEL